METSYCTTRKHGIAETLAQVKNQKAIFSFAVQHLPEMTDMISQFALQAHKGKKLNMGHIHLLSFLFVTQDKNVTSFEV